MWSAESARAPAAVGHAYRREFLWIPDGERAQPDRVHEPEDGGVGADAQRQGENGDRRESWIETQQPRAIAEVLPGGFQNSDRIHVAHFFFHGSGIAESAQCGPARLLAIHSGGHIVIDLVREVGFDLSRHFLVAP